MEVFVSLIPEIRSKIQIPPQNEGKTNLNRVKEMAGKLLHSSQRRLQMNFFGGFSKAAAFGAAVLIGVASQSQASFADTFAPTYLGPGVQTPTGITTNYNTFDGLTYNGSSL